MTAKEILQKIKQVFEEVPQPAPAPEPAPEPMPAEFKEYTLADGSKVKIDNLAIGGKVMLVSPDGTEVQAPAGEHILATGEKIEVDAEGLIYEMESPEATAVGEEEMKKMKDEVAMLTQKLADAETKLQSYKEASDAEGKKIKEGFSQLVSLVESLMDLPAEEHTEKPQGFSEPKNEREARILAAQKAFENLKK